MKFVILFVLVMLGLVAVTFWLLPWWASVALVVCVFGPVGWVSWKILSVLKSAAKQIKEGWPQAQERVCSLPAGEPFRGNGFAFTFPVPCEVSQTVIDDLEILLLKPKLTPDAPPDQSLVVVSTMPVQELKDNVNERLDSIFTQVKEIRTEPDAPVQVAGLNGERRGFEAQKEGKSLRGEMVYLGDDAHSVGWILFTTPDIFDSRAAQLRELTPLIRRVSADVPKDVVDVDAFSSPIVNTAVSSPRPEQKK
jgi:hypothetical protein